MSSERFERVNRLLAADIENVLMEWLPGGSIRGREYVCSDRSGGAGKSFSFNLDKKAGGDFAKGEFYGDLISLYAGIHNLTQGQALEVLEPIYGSRKAETMLKDEKVKKEFKPGIPPKGGNPPVYTHKEYGEPTQVHTYMNIEGDILCYVARYEFKTTKGLKKEFRPFSWCRHSHMWVTKAWTPKTPLYGLERLGRVIKPVLIVEGEKSADAAHRLCGNAYNVISWQGGSSAVKKADWEQLKGITKVLIWPDSDEPGIKAGNQVALKLAPIIPDIKVLMVPDKEGWDAADAVNEGWDFSKWVEWAKPIAQVYRQEKDILPVPQRNELTVQEKKDIIKTAFPDLDEKARPLDTVENLRMVLNTLNISVRYDVIKKKQDVMVPGESYSMDNKANAAIADVISWCKRVGLSTSNIDSYLIKLSDQNIYNPVVTWIQSKPWDGEDRLQALFDTVTVKENNEFKEVLIKKWLISAVAAAFEPKGIAAQGVLVFQGDQNLGKTSWLMSLVPKDMELTAEGMLLNPSDKDSMEQILSYWIVELGEIDSTFKRSDQAQLKAFLTRSYDKFRRPYARESSEYARRTVFFGSVNPFEYLNDQTGNRRFWTIACEKVDFKHCINMQQLWAQVHTLYVAGENWWLDDSQMDQLNESNSKFEVKDSLEERISLEFPWSQPEEQWTWLTATEILQALGYASGRAETTRCGMFVRKRNGGQSKRSGGITRLKIPLKISQNLPGLF